MGIPGLLTALRSVTYPVHISEYKGLTVGVDAYCWLHRGTFSCSTELCTNSNTNKYVTYCMKRVSLLRHNGAEPIMVFDGASLPMKGDKHLERRRQRETSMVKGQEALAAGESGAAAQHFAKATAVTHQMAYELIKELRRAGVKIMVAPYEADAQLAHLSRTGAVDAVITEDSDCLPYGCKKVMFKMDNEGNGQEIQLRNLAANKPLSLCNWKNSMFLDLCLLVGCDYITASIKGLGIATAHKLVDRHRKLDKIINAVDKSKLVVSEGYWDQYKRARLTFRHHIVYDSQTENTVHLMPLGDSAREMKSLDFLGDHLPPPAAHGVSSGRLNPKTHEPHEDEASTEPSASGPLSHVVAAANTVVVEASEKPPSPQLAEANEDMHRVHQSEAERLKHSPSTLPAQSRALIERPFCARRTVLSEVRFPVHDKLHQAPIAWNVAESKDIANNSLWAQQGEAQPQHLELEQRGDFHDYGISSTPRNQDAERQERVRVCGDSLSSEPVGAGVLLDPSARPIRSAAGLDLMRIRETPSPLAPEASSFNMPTHSQECLPRPSAVSSPPVNVAVGAALRPLSLPAHSKTRIPKYDLFDDLGPRDFQEGRVDYRGPLIGLNWGTDSSPKPDRDKRWREPYTDAPEPVWGEDYLGEAQGLPQEANGRQHIPPLQYYPTPSDEGRERNNQSANLCQWTCYAPAVTTAGKRESGPKELEARGVEAREVELPDTRRFSCSSSNAEEVETGEVAEFSLVDSVTTDRFKYLPASAQHFQSTQVSQGLETLHRRKRRLGMAPGALRMASANQDEPKVRSIAFQPIGRQSLPLAQSAASDTIPDGPWMQQAYPGQSVSGASIEVLAEPIDNKHSGGLHFFSRSHGSDTESTDNRNGASVPQPPPQHRNRGLVGVPERGQEGQGALRRDLSESPRPWIVPSAIKRKRRTDFPLLRLMEGDSDNSLHGVSAPRITKRSQGMDYWDARLMRW